MPARPTATSPPRAGLDDLRRLIEAEVAADARRWLVGFGFGGVLSLHLAAGDDRVAGVACLGTPADLDSLTRDPGQLVERCVRTGVIRTPGFPRLHRRGSESSRRCIPRRTPSS